MRFLVAVLLVLAVAFNSGFLFFFIVLLLALHFGTRAWTRAVGAGLRVERHFERRVFYGESVEVTLGITNTSALPAPWVQLRDHLPPALILPSSFAEVFALGPGQTHRATYRLTGRRRGFHAVGPLTLTVGDVFGQAQRTFQVSTRQYLIVYPEVLPLERLGLPTLSLFGDLRSRRKILGDPARLAGVRDYAPGDPLHDIHWRATASTGALQVKQFQPSTTVQTTIFLDMARGGYTLPDVLAATDLAVTVAASLASNLVGQRQQVGLITNGQVALPPTEGLSEADLALLVADPAAASAAERTEERDRVGSGPRFAAAPVRSGKGHGHLMHVMELLARLEIPEGGEDLVALLQRESFDLPWGSTVVAITGSLSQRLFAVLHRLREAGLLVVLLDIERRGDVEEMEARAVTLGVRLRVVPTDDALATAVARE